MGCVPCKYPFWNGQVFGGIWDSDVSSFIKNEILQQGITLRTNYKSTDSCFLKYLTGRINLLDIEIHRAFPKATDILQNTFVNNLNRVHTDCELCIISNESDNKVLQFSSLHLPFCISDILKFPFTLEGTMDTVLPVSQQPNLLLVF
jgi:hypothetical protein